MNESRFDSVLHRIRSLRNPQNVWINTKGVLCCGDSYPPGMNFNPVGTYTGVGFDEKQFREDVRFAESIAGASC